MFLGEVNIKNWPEVALRYQKEYVGIFRGDKKGLFARDMSKILMKSVKFYKMLEKGTK